jgi:tetratricopeptide (TPR) repeat protein
VRRSLRHITHISIGLALFASLAGCRQDPQAAAQRYLQTGDRYISAGKIPEAVIEFRNAAQQDPHAGNAHVKLADALLQEGDIGGAAGEYIRAADLLPNDLPLQIKAGNFLLLAGRFDDAKARAQKVLEKAPRNVAAQIVTANALAGLKDVDAAVTQIEDALRVDPDRSDTYASLGALELSRGKRDEAEQAFTKAVALQPDSVVARLALGNFYWSTGQIAAAEQSMTRALQIDPKNPLTNRALANFYLATNRPASAEGPLKTIHDVTHTPASAFDLAEFYAGIGNEPAARDLLQGLLIDTRAATSANARLAALDYKTGHRDEAYRRLAVVLDKEPDNLQALLVKSTLLVADAKPDEALAAATTAKDRHPESTAALFVLGRVQSVRKQPEAAIAAYQEVLRLNPRATDAKLALAQLTLARGQPDTSVGFSTEALVNEPANGDAKLMLVRGLLAQGDLDRAATDLKQLMALFPNSADVHTEMGMLLGRRRDFVGARRELERAQQLQPDGIEALGGLLALDLAVGDKASAKARVDARVAANPTAVLLTLAARTYAASGDFDAAESYLRRSIDLDSTYLAAYGGLGQLYASQGKLGPALAEFQALAARSPKSVPTLTMLGIILQAEGNEAAARGQFERVLQIDPEAAVAANNLAWIYAETNGNLDIALQLAKTAQEHLPGAPEVNDTLGFIYYKRGLASLAIPPLKMSAEKDPDNATYRYHLGLAYASAGDSVQARQSLARALALKPDFRGAEDARHVLGSLR